MTCRAPTRHLHMGCGQSLQSSLLGLLEPTKAARCIQSKTNRRVLNRRTERTDE